MSGPTFTLVRRSRSKLRNPGAVLSEMTRDVIDNAVSDAIDGLLDMGKRIRPGVSLSEEERWVTLRRIDGHGDVVEEEDYDEEMERTVIREAVRRAHESGGTFELKIDALVVERYRPRDPALPDTDRIQNCLDELRTRKRKWEVDADGFGVSRTAAADRQFGLLILSVLAVFFFPCAFLALIVPKVARAYFHDMKGILWPERATLSYAYRDGELRVEHRLGKEKPEVTVVPADAINAVFCLPLVHARPRLEGGAKLLVMTPDRFHQLRTYPQVHYAQHEWDFHAGRRLRDLILAWRGLPPSLGDGPWGDPFLPSS